MSPAARLGAFALVLALAFGVAYAVGRGADDGALATAEVDGHEGEPAHGDDDAEGGGLAVPAGLATAERGLRFVEVASPEGTYAFRIERDDGAVRAFDVEHEKQMHLVVVRRDLTGFQHLHPAMDADGTWRTPLDLPVPGAYRVFADFVVDGERYTLGADALVPGDTDVVVLPPPAPTADAGDGYTARLHRSGDTLHFTVERHGHEVHDLQPYLGAMGHLVALRAGDLAYLHVHPHEDDLAFDAGFPSAGAYRLFLQFRHDGRVRTAPFTLVEEG